MTNWLYIKANFIDLSDLVINMFTLWVTVYAQIGRSVIGGPE